MQSSLRGNNFHHEDVYKARNFEKIPALDSSPARIVSSRINNSGVLQVPIVVCYTLGKVFNFEVYWSRQTTVIRQEGITANNSSPAQV